MFVNKLAGGSRDETMDSDDPSRAEWPAGHHRGSERSSTSKDTELKLTDVARASLSELRGDCEIFILDRGELPWSVHSPEARAVNAISLDQPPFADDMVHESAKREREQRCKVARWLDAEDPVVVANAMLIILGRALNMLKSQIAAQGEAFEPSGGFSERLTTRRLQAREGQRVAGPAPPCPKCGQTMRRRKSAKGELWGCAGFPECKGTRPIEKGDV